MSLRPLKWLGLVVAFAAFAMALPFRPVVVVGSSMAPTYASGEWVWVKQNEADFAPGDVVVAQVEGRTLLKRVIESTGGAEGHVFLVGDNFRNSVDSRRVGWIPKADLLGKVTDSRPMQIPANYCEVSGKEKGRT
jgi:signal peptidase I